MIPPRFRVAIHWAGKECRVVLGVEVIASRTPIGVVRGEYDVSVGIQGVISASVRDTKRKRLVFLPSVSFTSFRDLTRPFAM